MRWASAPSSVSSSRPSLSWSRRPAGYTPGGSPNPASVRRGGTLRSVNWHRTWKGLLRARSMWSGDSGFGGAGCHALPNLESRIRNPGPSGPDKPQRHPVAFADRLVPGVVRVVVVVGRWQGPHAVGVVLGVLRVGVDPALRVELETGRLGHRDHLLLADIAGL